MNLSDVAASVPSSRRRAASGPPGPLAYHLKLRPGTLPPRVLVPGDPARATAIAEGWDRTEALADHREFRSYRGTVGGVSVGVVSSGIGGPAMAIVVEELAQLGVGTILRVGSCGPIDPTLRGGEVAISLAAARFEGTTRAYAPPGYPAVADPEVVGALVAAARHLKVPYRVGITATVDTFHRSQGRTGFRSLPRTPDTYLPEELRALGILNIEMEASTLLTIARLYGLRAGAICAVYPDGADGDPVPEGQAASIAVANDAIRRLGEASRADRDASS